MEKVNKERTITIKWIRHEDSHLISLKGNGYSGTCLTHNCEVTQNSKCKEFPPQTSM